MLKLDLQLFSETPGGEGADVSAGSAQQTEQTQGTETTDFDTLINGQYRQQFEDAVGKRVQTAIQNRFRNQADLKQQLAQYAPIMDALGTKYGMDAADVAGIAKKLSEDDSLYAEEASRQGLPVETYKNLRRLEAENSRMKAQQEQSAEDAARRQHFDKLMSQAEEMKKTFPGFDLLKEMEQNPRFVRMTAPGVGMSVQEAYYAIHGQDIQQQSMQYAAQQATKAVADSVRSGAARPMEGGMQSTQPATMGTDPSKLSKQQLAEVMRRVKAGEIINFRDRL